MNNVAIGRLARSMNYRLLLGICIITLSVADFYLHIPDPHLCVRSLATVCSQNHSNILNNFRPQFADEEYIAVYLWGISPTEIQTGDDLRVYKKPLAEIVSQTAQLSDR